MKFVKLLSIGSVSLSHPARGAWIEIGVASLRSHVIPVAPRKGCVD